MNDKHFEAVVTKFNSWRVARGGAKASDLGPFGRIFPIVPKLCKVTIAEAVDAFIGMHPEYKNLRKRLLRRARNNCPCDYYEMDEELWIGLTQ